MSDKSGIEWTDATWNPVTGCTKVSPGCDHCYAETFAERWRGTPGHHFENGFDLTLRPERLGQPIRWTKPRRIFVNSMSDLFHDGVPDEFIARVWQAMSVTPQHTYQILTKRHARMRSWVTRWYSGEIAEPYDVRPVPGYPGYSVTTRGEVFGKRSDTTAGLAQEEGRQGHCRVTMHREGSPRSGERELVHRLVLAAFVRPPVPGEQACHRNGDPTDNRLSNLYWGTQADNWQDRRSHGNGRSYHKLSVEDVAEIRRRYGAGESAYRIARDYPVSDTQWRETSVDVPTPAPARVVLDHCWLGVSVEDQKRAALRIPALLDTPAAVRWISAEPLLGPLYEMDGYLRDDVYRCACGAWEKEGIRFPRCAECGRAWQHQPGATRLDWVVAGGESGPRARPMHLEWVRSLRDQCTGADVPFMFKQWGAWCPPRPEHGQSVFGYVTNEDACQIVDMAGRLRGRPWPGWAIQDGTRDAVAMRRYGKKKAGRLLDGRHWDEYPGGAS